MLDWHHISKGNSNFRSLMLTLQSADVLEVVPLSTDTIVNRLDAKGELWPFEIIMDDEAETRIRLVGCLLFFSSFFFRI